MPLLVALLAAACTPSSATMKPLDTTTTVTVEESTTTTSTAPVAATEMVVETTIPEPFLLTSPAFADDGMIPAEHTCDGPDTSPQLDVSGLPGGTESVIIVVEDPDADLGTWEHWVVFDVPAEPTELQIPAGGAAGGTSAVNSWKVTRYKGPCPPEGEEHRYFFSVYALNNRLELPEGVDSAAVFEAMQPFLINSAELMGRYARP